MLSDYSLYAATALHALLAGDNKYNPRNCDEQLMALAAVKANRIAQLMVKEQRLHEEDRQRAAESFT